MDTSALEYDLPPELIAQHPVERRDESRLLVYDRATGDVRHRRFLELPEEIARGELVVVNDSRVVPARLRLRRPGGGEAEVLLLEAVEDGLWEGLARPSLRVLESLARGAPLAGRTDLYITPGFEFRRVDALLTNFHLPRSTLLALVMAFVGIERTRALYREAIERRYRFYSFGDAMLIL